ncbi:glycosyltransferase [Maritimibacter sp. UBA3975]|uniref:glycosyltransferase n=1 Tax=Maritimibacter sp. UBA3975 TaxID=1946833 RepID=UPI000C0ACA3E|nr:glycosyltransferase [Maritimibacter sp. UBA3975]MAM62867.1 hypothetical protein [Maritimibacter sp.]|tara:strand:+ start:990 stop:2768 length:1779 start_codon:yes stop_codon:yes gene_type:complete
MTAYRIQDVIGPDFGRPAVLYRAAGDAVEGPMPWAIRAGETFDFNSYFNAFFPESWHKHTQIGSLGVEVETTGPVRVSVDIVEGTQAPKPLLERVVDGRDVLWLDDVAREGRVVLRLTAEKDAQLADLGWVTDVAPVTTPTLSVGLCTFNREREFTVTLSALADLQAANPAVGHIWVANQGASFTDPTIADLATRPGITVIEQPNLGGCGGFTRTMAEATADDETATHHLLMDDDIVLDPRVVDRGLKFLSYVDGELALGGQMIDLDDPTTLREFGAKLDPTRYVQSIGENVALGTPEELALFHDAPRIDYNAWWFCVIPTASIRRLGLPTPIFIRGDDIEYGCLMSQGGVETISLPGVAVWHESFQHKTSDWLEYYNMRNRLFVATLYPELVWRPAAYYLLGYCMVFLFQHRYRTADMVLHAIEDVLAGADTALGEDGESRHMRLMKRVTRMPAYEELAPDDLPETRAGTTAPLDTSVPAMVWMSVSGFIGQHFQWLTRLWKKPLRFPYVPMPNNIGANDYIAPKTPSAEAYILYRSRVGSLWSIMLRAFWVCARYGLTPKSHFDTLARDLKDRRQRDRWNELFKLPRGRF